MARAVESAKRALWSLLRSQKEGGSAKLTISTVKGDLKVNFEQSFPPVRRNVANLMPKKSKKSKGGSYMRRKEKRASDQLVQQRAAAHRARSSSSESSTELGETLASPEIERASAASTSLLTSPAKDEDREELCSATLNPHLQITPEKEKEGDGPEEEREQAVETEKPPRPLVVVPED